MQYTQNEIQDKQIKALQAVCQSFVDDAETPEAKVALLREFLKVKEIASSHLSEFLHKDIKNLLSCGVSAVSVLSIAEAVRNELTTNLAQMEIFADRLSSVLHHSDIREAYGNISERLMSEADELIEPLRLLAEEAMNDATKLEEVEAEKVWHKFSRELKNKIH